MKCYMMAASETDIVAEPVQSELWCVRYPCPGSTCQAPTGYERLSASHVREQTTLGAHRRVSALNSPGGTTFSDRAHKRVLCYKFAFGRVLVETMGGGWRPPFEPCNVARTVLRSRQLVVVLPTARGALRCNSHMDI